MHTTASDGGQKLHDFVRVAEALGLDFLVLGDHNVINPEYKTTQSKVTIVPGLEFTPGYSFEYDNEGKPTNFDSDPNHLLAIGITEPGTDDFRDSQTNVDTIAALGGLSFLAHPADYWLPWNDWQVEGYNGLEIWTYLSDWGESVMIGEGSAKPGDDPDATLTGPNEKILQHWDTVGLQRRVIGIGSTDSHSKIQTVKDQPFLAFPLKKELHSIRTHVLLADSLSSSRTQAIGQIVTALSKGRCYIALDSLADATGFQFWLEVYGRRHDMGDEVSLLDIQPSGILHIRLPSTAKISVVVNGEVIHRSEGDHLDMPIELDQGVCRVEARMNDRIWILSNPVYLRV